MRRLFALALSLVAVHPVSAQQAEVPVDIASPGVAPLRFVTYVAPVYPQIAISARVTGEVRLAATVDSDGRTRDIRVVGSRPLFDQSAIDAVRRWAFETPTVRGLAAPVRVPITLSFLPHSSLELPAPQVRSPNLPSDFTIAFTSNCPDGTWVRFDTATGAFIRQLGMVTVRAVLWPDEPTLESLHSVIARSGLMDDRARLAHWPEGSEIQTSSSGIYVLVHQSWPTFLDRSSGPALQQPVLDVRMNGEWTRLFPPMTWQPDSDKPLTGRDAELDRGVRQIARLIDRHVQSIDAIRKLPRNQQWCRWPD